MSCLGCAFAAPLDDFRAALRQGDLGLARQILERQIADHSSGPDWLLARTDLLAREGRVADALGNLRESLVAHPRHRSSRIREGQLLSQMGRLHSAAEVYARVLQDWPEDADALTGLALTHLWRGHVREATLGFAQALGAAPDNLLAQLGQIRTCIQAGQTLLGWTIANALDRQAGQADGELGLLLAGLADRVGATEVALTFTDRPTSDPDLRRRQAAFRARLLIRRGKVQEGLALVEQFVRSETADYDTLFEIADLFAAGDRRDSARTLYERAARLTPERPEAPLGLARLTSRSGRLSGSLALYRAVVERNPESLEGWLGVIRTARLLDDTATAREALARSWIIAPSSITLAREQLLLDLQLGHLDMFQRHLAECRRQHPDDLESRLWEQRLRAVNGETLDPNALLAACDPLSPDLVASALALWLRAGGDPSAFYPNLDAPLPELLQRPVRAALARALALELQPAAANRLASTTDPAEAADVRRLAAGWWAFATTPLAHAAEVADAFDAQSLTVWLAGELQRRFRTLHVETEGRLWEDWLLLRAHWFAISTGRHGTAEATLGLRTRLLQFGEGWTTSPRLAQVEEAWRLSEAPLPTAADTYGAGVDRARWRLYRHDYAGALAQLQQLARDHPGASEPVHRQAEVLRTSGRFREALRHLAARCQTPSANPGDRLEYADLLRRLGRSDEAEFQLRILQQTGFDEPAWFVLQAALAETRGRPDAARASFEQGLDRYPTAGALRLAYAEWLIRRREPESLALLLEATPQLNGLEPDHVAAAVHLLPANRLEAFRRSTDWWWTWRWLAWERLPRRSVLGLQALADAAAGAGSPTDALNVLQPALLAQLPDSDLWLKGARFYDLTGRPEASERAFRFAAHFGCGRLDADMVRLVRTSRRQPILVARELARRLEDRPDERPLRLALVYALLRAKEIAAADRALAPLVEEDPSDPEVRTLAAEVRAAQGQIRQARSLHESLLRQDPLAADPRAARRALNDANEVSAASGYDYQFRWDTTGADASLDDWSEFFLSGSWRQPHAQSFAVEYHGFERSGDLDHQLWIDYTHGLDRNWILRLQGGAGMNADFTSLWRAGAGISRTLFEQASLDLDARFLKFEDIEVWQLTPAFSWRWHPRGTLEGRVYIARNQLDSGTSNVSLTGLLNASWQLGQQSLLVLRGAWGDENSANPTADLIGNDSLQSYGLELRLGLRHRWTLTPGCRYEIHERFDLFGASLSLGYSY